MTGPARGLTAAEVADRVRRGLVNRTPRSNGLAYLQILGRNVGTWFNAMVAPAAVALFVLHEYQGALAVSGMAAVNTILGLAQELRAKRHLDRLAILVETRVKVLRDAQIQEIAADDVVQGDHVLIAGGEPVIADGEVLEAHFLEIDEALLTGESDPVRRHAGDQLLSGSVCIAGEGTYRADKVGTAAFASQTAAQARRYHATTSPLTRVINRLVQVLSYTAIALIILFTIAYILEGFPKSLRQERDYVRMVAATITSMVPQGMVLTATIALMLGAIAVSRRGAIVQRLQAVETMAAIDVICTDKTGTLTTNRLRLEGIEPLDDRIAEDVARERLRMFVSASIDRNNKNLQAVQAEIGSAPVELLEQIPFKAQNRYSAVRVSQQGGESVLVLGAVEALFERVRLWEQVQSGTRILSKLVQRSQALQMDGLRLLLLAEPLECVSLAGRTTFPDIPLRPLALVCLADELRSEAGLVLEALASQGVAFKVVSGDNPETVRGTVGHLHTAWARGPVLSGQELAGAAEPAALIDKHGVFGRVTPDQKVLIIQALQKSGRHVAMIGDGVNDVLAIKTADLGIAMGEGSQASKAVSGLVLENNSFTLLPEVLEEGRTIVRNLRRSAKLFLVKNVYSLIFILGYASGVFGIPFPYVPQQVTLLNWLVIGIPALAIALSREQSRTPTKPRFLREVGWFAIRTGVVFGLAGLSILWITTRLHIDAAPPDGSNPRFIERVQRTMLLSVLIMLGITALWRALRDGEPATALGDKRLRLLATLALPIYLGAMYVPASARFFELEPLGIVNWGLVVLVAGAGYALTCLTDGILSPSV
jgi:cation-transporting ATPase E